MSDGIPLSLGPSLRSWIIKTLERGGDVVHLVAASLNHRLDIGELSFMKSPGEQLADYADIEDDHLLDVLDATLHFLHRTGYDESQRQALSDLLDAGYAGWSVGERPYGLQKRVDEVAFADFKKSTSPADEASAALAEAWDKAYGLHPDAADAWDHSIKAVEAILRPIAVPNKDKATLSDIAGAFLSNHKLVLHVGNEDADAKRKQPLNAARTLEQMLRLMWPDPKRHGGDQRPAPTLEQARGVVHLAVLVVQWGRLGALVLTP
ncbi:hypothetical protein AB2L28_13625 [Kineococcus sp. TBRC 1896]|uniref:Abortive infection Abi-like protein n=1 Tax=Kineococcus mangrovi TaxID=1660183 RepID=A0ABV4I444_9ACTN